MSTPPVLLLAFNRPDLTKQVLSAVREAKPAQIFYAVDGPRSGRAGDPAQVLSCQSLVDEIDWQCEIKTLFRDKNLGCRRAVSEAISWFFEHVEEGIILEDDCLPHPSFFDFCSEMLEHYRNDEGVGMISGDNFLPPDKWNDEGHMVTKFTFIWGWATWRRAWEKYDAKLSSWPDFRRKQLLDNLFNDASNPILNAEAIKYFTKILDDCYAGKIDSWAYRWLFSSFNENFLNVIPKSNLVSNIGFDQRATHTFGANNPNANLPTRLIKSAGGNFKMQPDPAIEAFYLSRVYGVRCPKKWKQLRSKLRKWRRYSFAKLQATTLPLRSEKFRTKHLLRHLKRSERFVRGKIELNGYLFSYPDPVSFAYAYEQIFSQGVYDLGRLENRRLRIIDCGANVGLATLYWLKKYPGSEITAVEADPNIHRYLLENLANNRVTSVKVINKAIWNQPGEVSFSSQGADAGSISTNETDRTFSVQTIPLAEILGNENIDLLKIDIEGAECEALIGHVKDLCRVNRVFVEYHSYYGQTQRLDEILATLRSAGFRLHLCPELVSPRPFVNVVIDGHMDQRINIYAWRQ